MTAARSIVAIALLALAGCTVRYETMTGGPNPGVERTTLALFADDRSTFTCSTSPDGGNSVTLAGSSEPNAASVAALAELAKLGIAGANPAAAEMMRGQPRAAQAVTACTPFAYPPYRPGPRFDAAGPPAGTPHEP